MPSESRHSTDGLHLVSFALEMDEKVFEINEKVSQSIEYSGRKKDLSDFEQFHVIWEDDFCFIFPDGVEHGAGDRSGLKRRKQKRKTRICAGEHIGRNVIRAHQGTAKYEQIDDTGTKC